MQAVLTQPGRTQNMALKPLNLIFRPQDNPLIFFNDACRKGRHALLDTTVALWSRFLVTANENRLRI